MDFNEEKETLKLGIPSQSTDHATKVTRFVPPDGGYGWVIVFASFMVHFILFGILNMSGIIFIQLLEDFHTGKAETALISSISVGTMMLIGPLSSILNNRFGPRVTSIVGAVIASVGYIASFFARNIGFLYISMGVVVGVGFGIAFLPFIVSIGFYFEKRKSLAVGISVCGQGVGTMFWAPVLEILIEKYGWRGSMVIIGGIILNIAVVGSLLRTIKIEADVEIYVTDERVNTVESGYSQITKEDNCEVTQESHHCDTQLYQNSKDRDSNTVELEHLLLKNEFLNQNASPVISNKMGSIKIIPTRCCESLTKCFDFSIFKNSSFVLFLLSNFFVLFGIFCPYIYLPDRSIEGGCSKSESALFISVIGFANIFGRVLVAILADCTNVNRQLLYMIDLVICGLVTIASPFSNTVIYLATYSAIFGFSMGIFFCLFLVVLMDMVRKDQLSDATGVALFIHGIALLIGPPVIGWVYTISGNYDVPFYATGAVIVIGGIILCFIPRGKN